MGTSQKSPTQTTHAINYVNNRTCGFQIKLLTLSIALLIYNYSSKTGFLQDYFYVNHADQCNYHCAEFDGNRTNSVGGVAPQRNYWRECIRASLIQLNLKKKKYFA